ncbi:hypothetical protein CYMTET_26393, partial [Cymbomonas tetramitiformis]|eukprot:gene21788-26208_t
MISSTPPLSIVFNLGAIFALYLQPVFLYSFIPFMPRHASIEHRIVFLTRPPLKLYSDRLELQLTRSRCFFGIGMLPALLDCASALRRLSLQRSAQMRAGQQATAGGLDSSRPDDSLGAARAQRAKWWDQLRYLWHGDFSVHCVEGLEVRVLTAPTMYADPK